MSESQLFNRIIELQHEDQEIPRTSALLSIFNRESFCVKNRHFSEALHFRLPSRQGNLQTALKKFIVMLAEVFAGDVPEDRVRHL